MTNLLVSMRWIYMRKAIREAIGKAIGQAMGELWGSHLKPMH